ncbi:putative transposase [Streptomyces bingchenggensis BCW-1]|uniref:Putative transposase n=1 Tax=Streptomyces bingchenggensis (strain BCW-1) TaxID=749414 RepID=D7CFK3_STRBB|nr:putative transposase [Streptomyces bingchenggensis BCW-1]
MREPRYPSDMTDAEWALIEPLLPVPACQKPTGGHPEAHPRREIVDGIRYLVDNGIKWRSMADYPPWRTIYGFARRWAAAGGSETVGKDTRGQNGASPAGREGLRRPSPPLGG